MIFLSILFLLISSLNAQEKQPKQHKDIEKISEAFGHLIGKNIDTIGIDFDLDYVIKGLQSSMEGEKSPMSEVECVQAISAAQEKAFKKQAENNLKIAEDFLSKNKKHKDIVSLENGKIQYKVEKQGKGEKVKANSNPIIKYAGKYIDGSIFGSSQNEEALSLDETIAGFTKGLVGMKEGEKRILYIHPEYGYGTSGYLPPNSLLTFEIEIIKANSSKEMQRSSVTRSSEKATTVEEKHSSQALR